MLSSWKLAQLYTSGRIQTQQDPCHRQWIMISLGAFFIWATTVNSVFGGFRFDMVSDRDPDGKTPRVSVEPPPSDIYASPTCFRRKTFNEVGFPHV